jgi:hypothetical protein
MSFAEGGQDLTAGIVYQWYKYVDDACAVEVCEPEDEQGNNQGCHTCIEECLATCSSDCEKCTGLSGKTCNDKCQVLHKREDHCDAAAVVALC